LAVTAVTAGAATGGRFFGVDWVEEVVEVVVVVVVDEVNLLTFTILTTSATPVNKLITSLAPFKIIK
jgi:hypothetical protein